MSRCAVAASSAPIFSSQPRLDPVAPAEEPRPHALLGEVGQLPVDRLREDLHQVGDLVGRSRPVLGREGVDGERLDPEVDRRLDGAPQRPRALAVALRDGQPRASAQRPLPSMMIATALAELRPEDSRVRDRSSRSLSEV